MESFTVDLSEHPEGTPEEHRFYDPILARLEGQLDRQLRVKQRVDELIKPDVSYQIIDSDGESLGFIGSEIEFFNIDTDTPEEGYYSPNIEDCDSIEQLDRVLFDLDVKEAILGLIGKPNLEQDGWSGQSPYETYREWIEESRAQEAEVRGAIVQAESDDEEETRRIATHCNGYLDTSTGLIRHQGPCPIHSH